MCKIVEVIFRNKEKIPEEKDKTGLQECLKIRSVCVGGGRGSGVGTNFFCFSL